jgi:ABC-type glycerol-3-phosphate transport system substrate-binding protein
VVISILKKIGYALIAIATIWLLFFYSNEKPIVNDGKLHIRYWLATGQKDVVPYAVKKFNSIQDSIVIDMTIIPWQEHEKKILTAILSGDPPDIISQFSPVAQWASRLALMPLDDFMQQDKFDSTVFFPALWQEMKWYGKTYAVPIKTASYAFFYNNQLFREAGLDYTKPPKTWAEVRELSKKLTLRDEDGRLRQVGFISEYGNLIGHGDIPVAVLMAWQLGAQFLSDDGTKVQMANPQAIRALQCVVDIHNEYDIDEITTFISSFGYAEQHAFLSDKVAMMCLQNPFIEQIQIYRPTMDYTVCAIPSFEGYPTASASGSFWVGIPRGAKHPRAAWEFMKLYVDKKTQLEEFEEMDEPLFPGNRLAAYDSSFLNRGRNDVFIKQMDFAHSPAIIPLVHGIFWREYLNARERAVQGLQTPTEALKQAETQVQIELDKAYSYDSYVRKAFNID